MDNMLRYSVFSFFLFGCVIAIFPVHNDEFYKPNSTYIFHNTTPYFFKLEHVKERLIVLDDVLQIRLNNNDLCCDFDFQFLYACKKLTNLNLSYNHFKSISNNLENQTLSNLEHINLGYNFIGDFTIEIFKTIPNLKSINLAFNNIKKIDSAIQTRVILPFIELIRVDGNQFPCNEIVNMLIYGANLTNELQWLPQESYKDQCSYEFYTVICNKTKLLHCMDENIELSTTVNISKFLDRPERNYTTTNYNETDSFNELSPIVSKQNTNIHNCIIIGILFVTGIVVTCLVCRRYHKVIIKQNGHMLKLTNMG